MNIVKMIKLKIIFLGKSLNKVVCLLRTQYIFSIRLNLKVAYTIYILHCTIKAISNADLPDQCSNYRELSHESRNMHDDNDYGCCDCVGEDCRDTGNKLKKYLSLFLSFSLSYIFKIIYFLFFLFFYRTGQLRRPPVGWSPLVQNNWRCW